MICTQCDGTGYFDRFAGFDIPCQKCGGPGTSPEAVPCEKLLADLDWLSRFLAGEKTPCAIVERARAVIAAQVAVLKSIERLREVTDAERIPAAPGNQKRAA